MVFLFSILAQWFSRGVLAQICLNQEHGLYLVVIFCVAVVLGSPVQGYMSDLTSRKRVILVTLSATIGSLLIAAFTFHLFSVGKFSIILGIAVVLNGVFGNIFPASGAALADKTGDKGKSLSYSFVSRYSGLLLPFVLPIPNLAKLLIGVTLGVTALIWVLKEFRENGEVYDSK